MVSVVDCSSAKTTKGFNAKVIAAARGSKLNRIVFSVVSVKYAYGNTITNQFHLHFGDLGNKLSIRSENNQCLNDAVALSGGRFDKTALFF
ncbi:hypothetical protein TUM4641_26610 [Shewanella morhuae]|nr:hypothetical protein TUM4641_26610 [Shewanella morhuae]